MNTFINFSHLFWSTYIRWLASLVAQGKRSCLQETQVQSGGLKGPWRRKCQPTPVFLPGKFRGQEPGGDTVQGVAEESHRPQGLNNNSIKWSCVFIYWWIRWICLHQIFLAPQGIFRCSMQILSQDSGIQYLGRWTLSCGMRALIPWWRTKCWSCPLGAWSLSHLTSEKSQNWSYCNLEFLHFQTRKLFW